MNQCPECGASREEGKQCRDYLDQVKAWEFEDVMGVGEVHLLTILCFNLQHPSLYSKKGLEFSLSMLLDVIGTARAEVLRAHRKSLPVLSTDSRDFQISATPESVGTYASAPAWTITIEDIMAGGRERYRERVKEWSQATFTSLDASHHFE